MIEYTSVNKTIGAFCGVILVRLKGIYAYKGFVFHLCLSVVFNNVCYKRDNGNKIIDSLKDELGD